MIMSQNYVFVNEMQERNIRFCEEMKKFRADMQKTNKNYILIESHNMVC